MSYDTEGWGELHDHADMYAQTRPDPLWNGHQLRTYAATPISHETKAAPEHTPRRRYDPNWQWTDHAACKGQHDLMNPDTTHLRGRGATQRKAAMYAEAIAICNGCTVRTECLAYAMHNREEHGVWGGETPEQRDQRRTGARA